MPEGGSLPALPADLDVESARLPAVYVAAKLSLQQCVAIDECKMWAVKAEALASYARQMADTELMEMAVRIQDRATRRAGELLEEIPPARGANQNIQEGTLPKVTRESAASEAGLSEHQRKTALRVAAVPHAEFERRVEGPHPPTVTQLAELGRARREPSTEHLGGRTPEDFLEATHLMGLVSRILRESKNIHLDRAARGLWPSEAEVVKRELAEVREWFSAVGRAMEGSVGL